MSTQAHTGTLSSSSDPDVVVPGGGTTTRLVVVCSTVAVVTTVVPGSVVVATVVVVSVVVTSAARPIATASRAPAAKRIAKPDSLTTLGTCSYCQVPQMTSIQPELWVDTPSEALEFYEAAFGATVLHRVGEGEDIVAQLGVGEAAFWVSGPSAAMKRLSPRAVGGTTSRTLLVVDDPDEVMQRAVAAGATETSPAGDEHGWRVGRLIDPFGHEWEIGRPVVPWPPS
jgi:PhnB protein